MKSFSGFKSPAKNRDTSLTGGVDENVVHGGQVHSVFNPQYVPGHQTTSSSKEEDCEQTSRSTKEGKSNSRIKLRKINKKKKGGTDCSF